MKILVLGIVLIVVIAAASARSACPCGFDEGSSPCAESSGRGKGIKAQRLPKPIYQASASAIKGAERLRIAEQKAAQAAASFTLPKGSGCSGIAAIYGDSAPLSGLYQFGHEPQQDESVQRGLSTSELRSLGTKALIAPRFSPVGDLCFPGNSQGKSEYQHGIVVPATPGKQMCPCSDLQADDEANSHEHDGARGGGSDGVGNEEADQDGGGNDERDDLGAGTLQSTTSQSSTPQASTLRDSRFQGGTSRTHHLRGSNSRGSRSRGMSSRGNSVRGSSSKNSHVSSSMNRELSSLASPSRSSCGCSGNSHTSYAASGAARREQDKYFSHEGDDVIGDGQVDDSSYGSAKMINYGYVDDSSKRLATNSHYESVDNTSNQRMKSFDYGPVDSTSNQQVKSFDYGPVQSFSHPQGSTCGTRPLSKLMSHAGVRSHPLLSALRYESNGKGVSNFDDFDVDAPAPSLSFAEQERIYRGFGKTLPTVPADPVSVAIAYKKLIEPLQHLVQDDGLAQGRQKSEAESSLYFGHKTTPADGREQAVERDVPEEGLNTVDKPIVELKIQSTPFAGLQLGSFGDQLEQEQATHNSNTGTSAYISYGDLGYGPIAHGGNTFVTRPATSSSVETSFPSAGAYEVGESLHKPIGKPLPGYVAGKVVFESSADAEARAKAPVLAEDEADDDYTSIEDGGLTTDCQEPGAVSHSSSQSSSQSDSQSSTLRARMMSNAWSRAAKSDCPFTS